MNTIKTINISDYFDNRGFIKKFFEQSTTLDFNVLGQLLISGTTNKDTVRGFHFQVEDMAEEKLIFPLTGRGMWFALDLRSGSNFKSLSVLELNPEKKQGYFIPKGFAHGMVSHTGNLSLLISASSAFDQASGVNISVEDPEIYGLIKEYLPSTYIYDASKSFSSINALLLDKTLPLVP